MKTRRTGIFFSLLSLSIVLFSNQVWATDSVCNSAISGNLYHMVFISASENSNSSYLGVFADFTANWDTGSDYEWGVAGKTYPGATHYFAIGWQWGLITYGESSMVTSWTGGYHGTYIRASGTGDSCEGYALI